MSPRDWWTMLFVVITRCAASGSPITSGVSRQGCGAAPSARYWSAEEAQVAVAMSRLVAAGVTVTAAHRAARNGGWLAEGVRVVVSSDHES